MGSAMARNLAAAGLRTTVWDRSPQALADLAAVGVAVAGSPQDAIRGAHVVITMLPTGEVVESVVFADRVPDAFAPGSAWAQMGTIGIEATTGFARQLGRVRPDVLFVDAPVSGSNGPAEAGQLLILASGPAEAETILRPAFDAIGHKTVWLGAAGQGSRMKLVVNAYMSILIEGVAEALELAGDLGIDAGALAGAIEGGPLDAPSPMPSCTRCRPVTTRPSSRCNGRSRMWTLPSQPPTATRCRFWRRSPGTGRRASMPAMAGRT
jgi:3-hydroxyisobutyrate dehydrogenase